MPEERKGHRSFVEFLDRELAALGMTHWYGSHDMYGGTCDYHDIGKIVVTEHRLLFFFRRTVKRRVVLANIMAEPDSPIQKGSSDALRIRVKNHETIELIRPIAEKFESQGFGLKAELVY